MLIKEIKFVDYNGEEKTKKCMFNLNRSDCFKLQMSKPGGITAYLVDMLNAKNMKEVINLFDEIIDLSYGVLSGDNEHFVKKPELTEEFKSSKAYDALFMDLFERDGAFTDFMLAVMPPIPKESLEAAKLEANKLIDSYGV